MGASGRRRMSTELADQAFQACQGTEVQRQKCYEIVMRQPEDQREACLQALKDDGYAGILAFDMPIVVISRRYGKADQMDSLKETFAHAGDELMKYAPAMKSLFF